MGYLFFITWALLAGFLILMFSSFKKPSFSDVAAGVFIGSMAPLMISAALLFRASKGEKEITRIDTYELISLESGSNQKYILHYRLPDDTIKMEVVKSHRCTIKISDEESSHIKVCHGFRVSKVYSWIEKSWLGPLLTREWTFSPPNYMEIVVSREKIGKINL